VLGTGVVVATCLSLSAQDAKISTISKRYCQTSANLFFDRLPIPGGSKLVKREEKDIKRNVTMHTDCNSTD
jgi:hypothetical protein